MNFEELKKNLKNNGFSVQYFETATEAIDYLDKKIDGKSVGIGGSMTIKDIKLAERLESHNKIVWHWVNHTPAEAANTDVYLLSANAIAETGEIINIDGSGNRVASAIYGHEDVYYIVGRNKISKDYDSALFRARNIAAPKNAQRLNMNTPCAAKGDKCYNCNSPERICRALTVLWRKPVSLQFAEVIVINEDLGF